MKKTIGAFILFPIHFLCCGALLYFLVSSGYLYLLSSEGNRKIFLIPWLIILGALIYLYRYHQKTCRLKQTKSRQDFLINYSLWLLIFITGALIFFIYLFLPWWIPGYEVGPLLP